ncbi:MAG: TetR/AcrR family transcriptional regulator [Geminicoccaceae bacterium]
MSRPRAFDEEAVLDRAMSVFRSKGFEGATLDELELATGLGRGSLYCAFGDKRQLFLRVFDRYVGEMGRCGVAKLTAPDAGRSAILDFFRCAVRDAVADRERHGCLVTNCAVELAAEDPEMGARVARELDRFERAFETAVRIAQGKGEIPHSRDPRRVARFLTVCLQGLQVLARARPDPAWLDDVVAAVEDALG